MPLHFNSTMLMPGSVILPGNWGRIVRRAGEHHTFWKREMVLEEVRKNEFPRLPSRLDCAYYFDDGNLALAYALADFARQCTMIMYEVELLTSDAPQFRADWMMLPDRLNPNADVARKYWSQADHEQSLSARRIETLSVTAMKIVRAIPF